jgi:hypothetical protein
VTRVTGVKNKEVIRVHEQVYAALRKAEGLCLAGHDGMKSVLSVVSILRQNSEVLPSNWS